MSDNSLPFDIPKECWAGVVKDEGSNFSISVEKVPVPEVGPDDVLIKLNATGLCRSDLHQMMNDMDMPKMSAFGTRCAGHEGAGIIVKVGERVKKYKVGQRAGCKPIQNVCGTCEYCKTGRDSYCLQAAMSGIHIDGSYKQYVISPEKYTTLIPDGVSDYVAGPAMCSGSTVLSSIRKSKLKSGQWAVFPGGGGGVGIQGVQLAAAMGIRTIVVDTGDERRQLAVEYGAEYFVDFKEDNPAAKVLEITGGGAHACFVTAVQSYPMALDYLGSRAGSRLMCIGVAAPGEYNINLDPTRIVLRGQSIRATFVSSLAEIDETLDFAKRGKLRLQPTIVGLSKFDESVQKLKNGKVAGRIVIDFNLP